MVIYVRKEELLNFLKAEIKAWENVGGGPNLQAYEFDRETTDPEKLKQLGYYDNPEAWIAGLRISALNKFLEEIDQAPVAGNKTL